MTTNCILTVYNKGKDGQYRATILGRGMWQEGGSITTAGNQVDIGQVDTMIFIPQDTIDAAEKQYIGSRDYLELDDPTGYWTVRAGTDFISRTKTADDVGEILDISKQSSYLKGIRQVGYKDFGSRAMWHIEIGAI